MFKIRQEQMEAFSQAGVKNFEDRMVVHLNKFFPEQCQALGEPKTREAIQYGIQQGASYGFVAERNVCKYIDLMFTFGRDFDKDAKLPWTTAVLDDESLKNPTVKMERLHNAAMEHLRQIAGIARGGGA